MHVSFLQKDGEKQVDGRWNRIHLKTSRSTLKIAYFYNSLKLTVIKITTNLHFSITFGQRDNSTGKLKRN